MKKLQFLFLVFPIIASAQLDFETNKFKLDFVKLPEIENLMSAPLPSESNFSNTYSKKLPSFKMNKQNYREPVSMFEAMAATQNYIPSDIQISIDPREYGVYGGNANYSADGATSVMNIAYKESLGYLRPELLPYNYGMYPRQRRSLFYANFGGYCITPSQ